jgi:choline dehydrogenase-like flavoprotein
MADNPQNGVVDANCRIHGVEGIFIAGSSVFPTGGHVNPTQTIVALSIRLADHLKTRMFRAASAASSVAGGP